MGALSQFNFPCSQPIANLATTGYSESAMEVALIGLRSSGKTTLFNVLTGGAQSRRPDSLGRVVKGISKVTDPSAARPRPTLPSQEDNARRNHLLGPPPPPASDQEFGYFQGPTLNALQGADAFTQVVRAFQNPTVPDAAGPPAPEQDANAMADELILADLAILERRSRRVADNMKGARGRERDLLIRENALLQQVSSNMEAGRTLASQSLTADESGILSHYHLLSAKPMMTVYNVGEDAVSTTDPVAGDVSLCASLEWEFAQLSPEDEREFRQSMGAEQSGKELLLAQTLALLQRVTFFTHVSQEVRAWTVPEGAEAAAAAGSIHSDMERGFIRAEVVPFDDMIACGAIAERVDGASSAPRAAAIGCRTATSSPSSSTSSPLTFTLVLIVIPAPPPVFPAKAGIQGVKPFFGISGTPIPAPALSSRMRGPIFSLSLITVQGDPRITVIPAPEPESGVGIYD